jgi:hypothetical protein
MQTYITDSKDRKKFTWINALISMTIAYLTYLLTYYVKQDSLSWLCIPSMIAYYIILDYLSNAYSWKSSIVRRILSLDTPNLNGIWDGDSTYTLDSQCKTNISIGIKQTLDKIHITLASEETRGHSITASVFVDDVGSRSLRYEYIEEPRNNASQSVQMHRGSSRLILVDEVTLDGSYYSVKGRQGLMLLKRVKN